MNGGELGNGVAAGAGGHGTRVGNGSQGDTVGAPGNGFPGGNGGSGPTVASLAATLVERLGWQARVALLVGNEDPESWLPDDEPALSPGEAFAVAYFMREGAWPESGLGLPDPRRVANRGDLARLLLHAARSCDLLDLDEAIVRGGDESALTVSRKGVKELRRIDPSALLFADFGAGPAPVRRVAVVAGDKVRYHAGAAGALDELLLLPGRQGASDDRYSSVSTWQVAYTAEELAKRLDQYLGSGSLLDVVAVRRGVSGRVTELKVVGTGGQAMIKGFRIRTALGLKENLFTIVRQRTRAGALRRVVFTGRGWGHGVGLCQIGSYGMALRGASYREILAHYYSGAILARVP